MRACSSASGGVMFIPDTIERKQTKVSYSDLAPKQEAPSKSKPLLGLFGKKKKASSDLDKAA